MRVHPEDSPAPTPWLPPVNAPVIKYGFTTGRAGPALKLPRQPPSAQVTFRPRPASFVFRCPQSLSSVGQRDEHAPRGADLVVKRRKAAARNPGRCPGPKNRRERSRLALLPFRRFTARSIPAPSDSKRVSAGGEWTCAFETRGPYHLLGPTPARPDSGTPRFSKKRRKKGGGVVVSKPAEVAVQNRFVCFVASVQKDK